MCSCYGAESEDMPCCTTCEEVREAYRKKGWAISNPKVSSWGKVIVTFWMDVSAYLPKEKYFRHF